MTPRDRDVPDRGPRERWEPWENRDTGEIRPRREDVLRGGAFALEGRDELDDEAEWTEEDERRYQARRHAERRRVRRRRRQAAAFAVVVLAVLGAGFGAAGVYQGWWEWPFGDDATARSVAPQPCPTPEVTAAAPADVQVAVLNATKRTGMAGGVAAELQARGFAVPAIGNDSSGTPVPEAAQVRHGPDGLKAARTVAAQIPGSVLVDDGRAGSAVEVALGDGYQALAAPEAAAALLTPAPAPSPAGCIPATPAAGNQTTGTPTG